MEYNGEPEWALQTELERACWMAILPRLPQSFTISNRHLANPGSLVSVSVFLSLCIRQLMQHGLLQGYKVLR
jgi:hypothetical protein